LGNCRHHGNEKLTPTTLVDDLYTTPNIPGTISRQDHTHQKIRLTRTRAPITRLPRHQSLVSLVFLCACFPRTISIAPAFTETGRDIKAGVSFRTFLVISRGPSELVLFSRSWRTPTLGGLGVFSPIERLRTAWQVRNERQANRLEPVIPPLLPALMSSRLTWFSGFPVVRREVSGDLRTIDREGRTGDVYEGHGSLLKHGSTKWRADMELGMTFVCRAACRLHPWSGWVGSRHSSAGEGAYCVD